MRSPHRHQATHSSVNHEKFLYMREAPTLSWRLDPDESLSDWTLRVSSLNTAPRSTQIRNPSSSSPSLYNVNAVTKTYFVHRTQLAVGPRRSEYFARLFRLHEEKRSEEARDDAESKSERMSVSNSNIVNATRIEVLPSAALAFPVMLDYLYSAPGSTLDVDTKSAVALRHLASSFGIKSLFHETTDFIKNDLNSDTAPVYLVQAKMYKNEKVTKAALHAIAKEFKTVKMTALSCLPPDHMVDILQSSYLSFEGKEGKRVDSDALSIKIASYCRCRQEDLTLSLLESLTKSTIIPNIAEQESIYFLNLWISLGGDESGAKKKSDVVSRCLIKAPFLLQKILGSSKSRQCDEDGKTSIEMNIHDSKEEEELGKAALRQRDVNLKLYEELPNTIKVRLLEKILGTRQNHQTVRKSVPVKKPTTNVRKAKKKVRQLEGEMRVLKTAYEKKMQYLNNRLEKKDEELMKVASYLNDAKRKHTPDRLATRLPISRFAQY